jgi:hypothetical protein
MARTKKNTKCVVLYTDAGHDGVPLKTQHVIFSDTLDMAKAEIAGICESGKNIVEGSLMLVTGVVELVTYKRETVTSIIIGTPKPKVKRGRKPKAVTTETAAKTDKKKAQAAVKNGEATK